MTILHLRGNGISKHKLVVYPDSTVTQKVQSIRIDPADPMFHNLRELSQNFDVLKHQQDLGSD